MADPFTSRPEASEHNPYFGKYIQLVPNGDIREFLDSQLTELLALLTPLAEPQSLVRHAPYTWSIKQVLGHMTDGERVFGHRALWVARGASAPLSSFDENDFMRHIDFDHWPFAELLEEFQFVRRSQIHFFRHLDADAFLRRGIVGEHSTSVRAIAYVIAGHVKHHLDILHKRLK